MIYIACQCHQEVDGYLRWWELEAVAIDRSKLGVWVRLQGHFQCTQARGNLSFRPRRLLPRLHSLEATNKAGMNTVRIGDEWHWGWTPDADP